MKFVFFFELSDSWLEQLSSLKKDFPEVEFILSENRTEQDIIEAQAFIGGYIKPEYLQSAERLKIVFFNFTGPNFLPLNDLSRRKILISNTHGNADSVAERAIALALSFYGKIITYHHDLKQGRWHGMWGGGGVSDTWDSLYGKRCALIGTGEIGKSIARLLKAFNCDVIGFKQRPVSGKIDGFDHITLDLDEALRGSELVFISLPQTKETEGMINARILSTMAGKFIVNVGRGEVVEEKALYEALKNGVLKGAGLDVWYTYPQPGKTGGIQLPSTYPFHELPNVVLSPHVGGLTPHAVEMNISQTIENMRTYLKTGRPRFELDPDLMY